MSSSIVFPLQCCGAELFLKLLICIRNCCFGFLPSFEVNTSKTSITHNVKIKFPNWGYYSNTTNAIFQGQVSTCLVDEYEDYNYFGKVSFPVVLKVSK
jgi:hypothetical protein